MASIPVNSVSRPQSHSLSFKNQKSWLVPESIGLAVLSDYNQTTLVTRFAGSSCQWAPAGERFPSETAPSKSRGADDYLGMVLAFDAAFANRHTG